MKAAVLHASRDIRYEEADMPRIEPHEVLIEVKATGICGSDLPRVLGDAAHHFPIILGHEFAGVIVERGSQANGIQIGQRVVGVPLLPCGRCVDCTRGHYAQCSHYSFIGSRVNGSWAQYVKAPVDNVLPFNTAIPFEEAALVEPSTVALHALQHMGYAGDGHVAILGGGNIGLLTLQWVKLLGAQSVTVFDIDETRLATARHMGADHTLLTTDPNFTDAWRTLTGGRGYDVVLETAGSTITTQLSLELCAKKSKICLIGTPSRDITFSHKLFEQIHRKEAWLTGSWMSYSAPFPGNEWRQTIEALEAGRLPLKDVIFRTMALQDVAAAFELYRTPNEVKGKVMLIP
jgi:L-iditol 2-dehydrogenase